LRVVVRQQRTFVDSVLGNCEYRSFYVVNDLYGGWSYKCEHGFGSVDYADPQEVIKLATQATMNVHLAGSTWMQFDRKGLGEEVTPDEAAALVGRVRERALAQYPPFGTFLQTTTPISERQDKWNRALALFKLGKITKEELDKRETEIWGRF